MERKLTRKIMVGGVPVGGGAPVSIQSMLNTRTTDVDGCLAQIRALAAAGCEIARLAVPDMEAAEAFGAIWASKMESLKMYRRRNLALLFSGSFVSAARQPGRPSLF